MKALKWEKRDRYGTPYWFASIYKISRYTVDNLGQPRPVYYQVYRIIAGSGKWGNYVNPAKQHHKYPTLAQCRRIADQDYRDNPPTSREISKAKHALESEIY